MRCRSDHCGAPSGTYRPAQDDRANAGALRHLARATFGAATGRPAFARDLASRSGGQVGSVERQRGIISAKRSFDEQQAGASAEATQRLTIGRRVAYVGRIPNLPARFDTHQMAQFSQGSCGSVRQHDRRIIAFIGADRLFQTLEPPALSQGLLPRAGDFEDSGGFGARRF
jgi:hypothetical protein